MNSERTPQAHTGQLQDLAEMLSATIRYIPLLTGLLALGLLSLYALGYYGVLDAPSWQLLVVAGVTLAVGLAIFAVQAFLVRGRIQVAFWVFTGLLSVWAISTVILWQWAFPTAIIMVFIPPLAVLACKLPFRRLAISLLASVIVTLVMLWLEANPFIVRATADTQVGLASTVLVGSTVVLFAIGTFIARLFAYRSVQSRLLASFLLIMALPVVLTTTITAVSAFTNSQEQFSNSLQAVSSLKQDQVRATISTIALQLSPLELGNGKGASLLHLVVPSGLSPDSIRLNQSTASTLLRDIVVQYPASEYDEVFVTDLSGNVIVSTYVLNQGVNFADQTFFQEGKTRFHAELLKYPGKQNVSGDYKLVSSTPLYGATTQDVYGVIVAVSRSDVVLSAMGAVAGLPNTKTYLVNARYQVISTDAARNVTPVRLPVLHAIQGRVTGTSSTYSSNDGVPVLGYIAWDQDINAAIIAELPRTEVDSRALSSLVVSGLVGLFAIFVAAITAVSTSRAISDPIKSLAGAARTLATGDLTVRAAIDQRDEVGNLANSFNTMASQLQGIIGNLEQRVAERTEALEQQSLRLRTAAEVARDAASAPNLDALLDQAARLIMERFGFYHTGIFLLDEKREYAVLRASPSAAGQVMLERRHSLKVGEQGIVGRAAATGEPRIALDTGVDPVFFNNPLLPNTHSEMALPLKTSEGTIGVVDIQSEQPEAFTQDDIAIVQVMADQLATAIQRTNLLQQVQSQLAQLEQTYQGFTETTWRTFSRAGRPHIGYRFDNIRLDSIRATPDNARLAVEKSQKSVTAAAGPDQTLDVPIRLRGQVIGVVTLRFQSGRVPEATSAMIQQIADRLATALENARLLEDSLRRANKERAIGEITTKISASVNMRNVLQTAVEELGRAIPGSDVVIQFRPESGI